MNSNTQNQPLNEISEASEGMSHLDAWVLSLQPVLRHINLHRFLWGFTLVCAYIAWNRGLMLLYGLVAFLLAVLLVSHAYRLVNLKSIHITRQVPCIIEAGTAADFIYQLSSRGAKHFVTIIDNWLPVSASQSDSASYAAAHSTAKNANATIQTTTQATARNAVRLFVVRFKQQHEAVQSHVCHARGVYRSDTLQLASAYPLGIIDSHHTQDVSKETLHVLPETFTIQTLPALFSNQTGQGQMHSQRQGSMDELAGVRRYRRGDAFNAIHWPTTAKQISRGQPWVAKNFDSTDSPQGLILLNQFITEPATFELMLSIASSIAQHMSHAGFPVMLCGQRTQHQHWQTALLPHEQHLFDNLKPLAAITRLPTPVNANEQPYHSFISNMLASHTHANLVVTFSSDTLSLADQHRTHLEIRIDASLLTLKQPTPQGMCYHIHPQTSLTEVARLFADAPASAHPEAMPQPPAVPTMHAVSGDA